MDSEKLVQVAMNVIMHAGDARDYIRKAGTKLSALDLDGVEELLKKASAELVEAHKAQTADDRHLILRPCPGRQILRRSPGPPTIDTTKGALL